MNVSRLLETTNFLLNLDNLHEISIKINELIVALSNLSGNPSDQNFQNTFQSSMQNLNLKFGQLQKNIEPQKQKYIKEIAGSEFFLDNFPKQFSLNVSESPAAPASALSKITTFNQRRQEYIGRLQGIQSSLQGLGFKEIDIDHGEAEIGFLIPRDLFKNNLNGLIAELREVRIIIQAFAEIETGSGAEIIVRDISTSDPQFFFSIDVKTIACIASAITWGLATWKQVEEIKKLRLENEKSTAISDKTNLLKIYDEMIGEKIDKAVDEKLNEMLASVKNNNGRKNEQEKHLRYALESILSRLESGMTIELRALPPPKEQGAEDPKKQQAFSEINEAKKQLKFPSIQGSPTKQIPYQKGTE